MKIVRKDWGEERWIVNNDLYCGKLLLLRKGFRCSLHYHRIKHETFYVQSGEVLFELENDTVLLKPGMAVTIAPYQQHRFTGIDESEICEFSTHHEDSDSYRVEPSGPAP